MKPLYYILFAIYINASTVKNKIYMKFSINQLNYRKNITKINIKNILITRSKHLEARHVHVVLNSCKTYQQHMYELLFQQHNNITNLRNTVLLRKKDNFDKKYSIKENSSMYRVIKIFYDEYIIILDNIIKNLLADIGDIYDFRILIRNKMNNVSIYNIFKNKSTQEYYDFIQYFENKVKMESKKLKNICYQILSTLDIFNKSDNLYGTESKNCRLRIFALKRIDKLDKMFEDFKDILLHNLIQFIACLSEFVKDTNFFLYSFHETIQNMRNKLISEILCENNIQMKILENYKYIKSVFLHDIEL